MPSTYAHRCFGADVLTQLPEALQKKISRTVRCTIWAFTGRTCCSTIGAVVNPVNRLGNAMHEQPGTVFLSGRAA